MFSIGSDSMTGMLWNAFGISLSSVAANVAPPSSSVGASINNGIGCSYCGDYGPPSTDTNSASYPSGFERIRERVNHFLFSIAPPPGEKSKRIVYGLLPLMGGMVGGGAIEVPGVSGDAVVIPTVGEGAGNAVDFSVPGTSMPAGTRTYMYTDPTPNES